MIKKYEDFIKESHSKTIKLTPEEVNLFTSEPVLQNLISDEKVSLSKDSIQYDESDIKTKEILDQYLEIAGKVEEKVGDFKSFNESLTEEDDYNPYYGDDEESLEPIGVDNLETQGTNGLVCIFSPLESDMVEGWNNDEKVQKFIEEKRLFLNELSYDEWSIYAIEGDNEVKNYIIKNYSF
jgi:hypothetical protein